MVQGKSLVKELKDFGLDGSCAEYGKLVPGHEVDVPERSWKTAKFAGAFLVASAILVAVVTIAVVVPGHGSAGVAAAPVTAKENSSSDLITAVCNTSLYTESCVSSFLAYPGATSASLRDLVGIGLQIAKRDGQAGWEAGVRNLEQGSQNGGDAIFLAALADCDELMEASLSFVNRSIDTFGNFSADRGMLDGQIGDIQAWMSASLTDIGTCYDSLSETDSQVAALFQEQLLDAEHKMSNALAVINYWADSLESSDHNRRRLLSLSSRLESWKERLGGILSLPSDSATQHVSQSGSDGGSFQGVVRCVKNCFRADPVCGVDGVTYWCGTADAGCAGVGVAHVGFCSIENGVGGGKGAKAGQSLLLVHLVWLFFVGLLVIIELP